MDGEVVHRVAVRVECSSSHCESESEVNTLKRDERRKSPRKINEKIQCMTKAGQRYLHNRDGTLEAAEGMPDREVCACVVRCIDVSQGVACAEVAGQHHSVCCALDNGK